MYRDNDGGKFKSIYSQPSGSASKTGSKTPDWVREEDKFKIIFNSVPEPALLLDLDNNIEDFNDACLEYFPHPGFGDMLYGMKVPVSRVFDWLTEPVQELVSGSAPETIFTSEIESARGRVVLQVRIKKILDPFENHRRTLVIMNDITTIVEAEKTIKKAHDFYLTLFEEFPAMIWRARTDGQFDYFNRAWLNFTGRSLHEEKGRGWVELLPEEDRERFTGIFERALKRMEPFEVEFRLRHRNGQYRWMLCVGRPFQDMDGRFGGLIGSCYDITERKNYEEQLAFQALHDPLTGLPNRRMLEVILPRLIQESREGKSSALFFIDLDNFKLVNDNFGHQIGDNLLISLGKIIQKQLRSSDRLIRLGGDEFAVILDGVGRREAEIIASRLLEAVSQCSFVIPDSPDKSFNLYLSIGISMINGQEDMEIIMSRADTAMYRAKEQGGNRYVIYE